MSPDEYQQAWQASSSKTRITVDADSLQNAVQRNRQALRTTISVRFVTDIAVELPLLPVFLFLGVMIKPAWTWYLIVAALIWSAGYKLVIRGRRKQPQHAPAEPLLGSVKESLALLEYQIWSQRNTFWWTQLPTAIAMSIFFFHTVWQLSHDWLQLLVSATFFFSIVLAVYGFTYGMNKRVERKHYEPRRQELLKLLTSLGDESTGELNREYPLLMSGELAAVCGDKPSPRRLIAAGLAFLAILFIGVPAILFGAARIASGPNEMYERKSPFEAVRWDDSQPEVNVGGEWFKLISLDDIPASEIIAFSRQTFGDRWQKRFEEDLVELLTRMRNPPRDTVTLVVQSLTSSERRTLKDVSMTEANREAIRDAAQARQDGAHVPFADLVPDLRREKRLIGLAAMVMVDGEIVDSAVDGERKKGSGVPLEIDDQWHLGSVTKSITATMIARLVESGRMQWTDTVGEIFPNASIHEDWKTVTLTQLLTHTSGAPANFSFLSPRDRPVPGPERIGARRDAALKMMAKKPDYPPGEGMTYSNAGYTIAGAMAEKAAGESWENLVTREVFEPLVLKSAGFGPPKSPNKTLDQPRGHSRFLGRKVAADDDDDNTPIIGPAGSVRMTLEDLCTYATEHLRGELGEGTLLSAESYEWLHTPLRNRYAHGWIKYNPSAAIPFDHYWHNGSNTMWYALVVFIPEKSMVVAVTSNDGGTTDAEAAAWEIVSACAK